MDSPPATQRRLVCLCIGTYRNRYSKPGLPKKPVLVSAAAAEKKNSEHSQQPLEDRIASLFRFSDLFSMLLPVK